MIRFGRQHLVVKWPVKWYICILSGTQGFGAPSQQPRFLTQVGTIYLPMFSLIPYYQNLPGLEERWGNSISQKVLEVIKLV